MITLYTTHCPQCNVLEKKLVDAGIEFEVNDSVDELIARGFQAAPQLEIAEEHYLNFPAAVKWINAQKG